MGIYRFWSFTVPSFCTLFLFQLSLLQPEAVLAQSAALSATEPGEIILRFNYKNNRAVKRIRGKGVKRKQRRAVRELFSKLGLSRANKKKGRRFVPVYNNIVQMSRESGRNEAEIIEGTLVSLARSKKRSGIEGTLVSLDPNHYGFLRTLVVRTDSAQKPEDVIKTIEQNKHKLKTIRIEDAQINTVYYVDYTPNDSSYESGKQWGHKKLHIPEAWEKTRGSSNVVIGVIDTGVDYLHEDLKGKIWTNKKEIPNNNRDDDGNGYIDDHQGYDFVDTPSGLSGCADQDCHDPDNDPMDYQGHGTLVSGVIAAKTDNNKGIAGACPRCMIMPLRAGFMSTSGGGSLKSDDISEAIVYGAMAGADIINMSFSSSSFTHGNALDYAFNAGVLLVASAGNHGSSSRVYPGAASQTISVQSTDQDDDLSGFSAYGSWVDLGAPGDGIYTTAVGNKYQSVNGTSFSAPYVAGIAGLMKSFNSSLTHYDMHQHLTKSIGDNKNKLIDAGAAVFYADKKRRPGDTYKPSNQEESEEKQSTEVVVVPTPTPLPEQVKLAKFNVRGRVLASGVRNLRSVVIALQSKSGNYLSSTQTSTGRFSFRNVPAGEGYTIYIGHNVASLVQPITQQIDITGDINQIYQLSPAS